MPNEMLPPKSENLPDTKPLRLETHASEGEVGLNLDAELAHLAVTLQSELPSSAMEARLLDAAFAAGFLHQAHLRQRPTTLPHTEGQPSRWASFRPSLQWGLAGVMACICMFVFLGQWAAERQGLVAEVLPPQPGIAWVQVPEIQRSPLVATRKAPDHKEQEPSSRVRIARSAPVTVQVPVGGQAQVAGLGKAAAADTHSSEASTPWSAQDLLGAGARTHVAGLPVIAPMPMTRHEPLQTLRVRVAAEDLWRMGFYSTPPALNQPMLADFLVGEDGRPLGVRLVGMGQ